MESRLEPALFSAFLNYHPFSFARPIPPHTSITAPHPHSYRLQAGL